MGEYAKFPDVDTADATTVLEPEASGEGNWVGAPCVVRHDGLVYLAVRERTPEERGRAVTIYERPEPDDLTEVTTITADQLGVVSVERPALVPDSETGAVDLFLPVDTGAGDWEIRKLAPADTPAEFDPATARTVVAPEAGGSDSAGAKDPHVLTLGGRYYMFYSGHDGVSEQAHLATSADGETWTKSPANPSLGRQFWHDHHTRISCVVPAPDAPVWLVFYEGSGRADYGNTWNLRTGMGVSHDLETVADATTSGPRLSAPTADRRTGVEAFATCRYLDVLEREDGWEVFVEVAREDGSFELRRAEVSP